MQTAAVYYGPSREECRAVQTTEDGVLGNIHKYINGDWIVVGIAGDMRMSIVSNKDFVQNFVQKFPRPVDSDRSDRSDPPKSTPSPNSVA